LVSAYNVAVAGVEGTWVANEHPLSLVEACESMLSLVNRDRMADHQHDHYELCTKLLSLRQIDVVSQCVFAESANLQIP